MIFVKYLTEFYQISFKILVYVTDFSPQFMPCMHKAFRMAKISYRFRLNEYKLV